MTSFTTTEVKKQFPNAIERTYDAGQVIIYDGDAPGFVRFICHGAVKFYDTDAEGNEKIMHIGGEGSIFPLFYSFEDKQQVDGFYATLTKTSTLMVPLNDFHEALQHSPDYAFQTLQWYASEMDHIVLRLKSMEKSAAKQKILRALLYLSEQHATTTQSSRWYRTNFAVTQQTLADLAGVTRETVNAVLKETESLKLVRKHRQSFDIDREAIINLIARA